MDSHSTPGGCNIFQVSFLVQSLFIPFPSIPCLQLPLTTVCFSINLFVKFLQKKCCLPLLNSSKIFPKSCYFIRKSVDQVLVHALKFVQYGLSIFIVEFHLLVLFKIPVIFTVTCQWVMAATKSYFLPVKQKKGNTGWKERNSGVHLFKLPIQIMTIIRSNQLWLGLASLELPRCAGPTWR